MSRPRRYRLDFRDLMAQCEWNYARLLPLMRALGDDDSLDVSLGEERPRTVSIRVLERAPYTTTLRFEDQALHDAMPAPRLTVRLYHDARVAEDFRIFTNVDSAVVDPKKFSNASFVVVDQLAIVTFVIGVLRAVVEVPATFLVRADVDQLGGMDIIET